MTTPAPDQPLLKSGVAPVPNDLSTVPVPLTSICTSSGGTAALPVEPLNERENA